MDWCSAEASTTCVNSSYSADGHVKFVNGISSMGRLSADFFQQYTMSTCLWAKRGAASTTGLLWYDGSPEFRLYYSGATTMVLYYMKNSVSVTVAADLKWHHW